MKKEFKKGDFVEFGSTFAPAQVTEVYQIGEVKQIRLLFKDGSTIVTTEKYLQDNIQTSHNFILFIIFILLSLISFYTLIILSC